MCTNEDVVGNEVTAICDTPTVSQPSPSDKVQSHLPTIQQSPTVSQPSPSDKVQRHLPTIQQSPTVSQPSPVGHNVHDVKFTVDKLKMPSALRTCLENKSTLTSSMISLLMSFLYDTVTEHTL